MVQSSQYKKIPQVKQSLSPQIDIGTISLDNSLTRHERADAVANRRRILAIAGQLFEEHGVGSVTMADIAKAAGVGKGTLYRRFNNKAELCLALMDKQMTEHQNEVLGNLRLQTTEDVPYLEQLAYFLDNLVQFTDRHLPFLCEVQSSGLLNENTERELPHIWRHMTIKGLLNNAVQAGEISRQVDIEYTADALLAPLRANIFRFQRLARGYSLDRISGGLRTLVFALGAL